MNILYISHLSEQMFAGPNYSVPAQISAQAKYDNVFWWNLTDATQEEWIHLPYFHTQKEYSERQIKNLPAPFNRPDLVIFEAFYYFDDFKLSRECKRRKIPYVVVPRSALTYQGQKQKRLKKLIANLFIFKLMTKDACAIQYLTEKEKSDSGDKWSKTSVIIPNGIAERQYKKQYSIDSEKEMVGVSIGRIAIYQKGMDLLVEACEKMKNDLLQANISFHIYGPDFKGDKQLLIEDVKRRKLEQIIKFYDGVVGEEKEEVLKNADFFIMTSRFEGMPMALIEAMSYRIPCLVTEGSNMADKIENNHAGWGCRTEVTDIVDALKRMISDKDRFPEISNNAYELSKEYNWDKIAKETHEIYEKLLSQ